MISRRNEIKFINSFILISLLNSDIGSYFSFASSDHCIPRPTNYNIVEGTMDNTPTYLNG